MRQLLIIISFFCLSITSFSQELNCKVTIVSDQVQGTDKRIFDVLKTSIFEFMNNRKWTNDVFKNEERIDCTLFINILSRSSDDITGTIQVQASRPVFKSSYITNLLNFKDEDFQIKYVENQPLDFAENAHLSNLTSILAYYANLIIGIDYDSFSLKGGTPYLQKAFAIVNNAQGTSEKGWKAFDGDQNRYWLINNMLDAPYIGIREAMYTYHLKGLDEMVANKEAGRTAIIESFETLKKVHQVRPLSFNMKVFFNAKYEEIINIFKIAFPDEKAKVMQILELIDPTNSNKYQTIMNDY